MIEIGGTALSLLLCGVGGIFVGFIDSIAGGGGLVSLPMLLAMGLPPNLAIGTNKLAAACGNVVSSIQFIRAGKTKLSLAWRMIPLALAGSAAGSAKILAVGTNCTSLLLFIMWDQILYEYAVVLAAGLMIGAYFGSRTAIRRGAPFIRFVMMAVTIALLGKLLLEYGQAYLL